MDIINESNVKIQSIPQQWYGNGISQLDMLRLDLLHPVVSGNKWYKLRLNVMYALDHGFKAIVTFGGGYSNHLVAAAYTAKRAGLKSVGIVRGKYDILTPTLKDCIAEGMELIFLTKTEYDRADEPDAIKELVAHFDEVFIIPEGGANYWGRKGAGLICKHIKESYTHIVTSVGSATTLIGIRNEAPLTQTVLGFVPMKGGEYLVETVSKHLHPDKNLRWQLFDRWHFGGFGKSNNELIQFMNDFYTECSIPLDIIYTSKMMYGLKQLITEGYFKKEDKILAIHSGGLQGNSSVSGLIF